MPVTYNEVLTNLNRNTEWSDTAVKIIDTKLSNPDYVKDWVCNSDKNPTYRFAVPGVATDGDKQRIIQAYQKAGWGTVEVTNSAENGERPGMVLVVIKRDRE